MYTTPLRSKRDRQDPGAPNGKRARHPEPEPETALVPGSPPDRLTTEKTAALLGKYAPKRA